MIKPRNIHTVAQKSEPIQSCSEQAQRGMRGHTMSTFEPHPLPLGAFSWELAANQLCKGPFHQHGMPEPGSQRSAKQRTRTDTTIAATIGKMDKMPVPMMASPAWLHFCARISTQAAGNNISAP